MDDRTSLEVPGSLHITDALSSDPIFRLVGRKLDRPVRLGIILALLVILIVIFGPSEDSKFIYTDF